MATEVQQVNGGLGLDSGNNGVGVDNPVNGDVVVVANGIGSTIDSSASSSIGDEPPSIASTSSASTSAPAPAEKVAPAAAAPLPTYDDIFPALPGGLGGGGPGPAKSGPGGPSLAGLSAAARLGGGGGGRSAVGPGAALPKIRSSNVQKAYRVAPEERRALNRNRFGETSELGKICSAIMANTGTDIQLTTSRDGTLNFLISGKEDATTNARRALASEFQAQITQTFNVPKEHHRIILGKGGAKLAALEQSAGVKIQIPKQDDASEGVRITGTRESIEKAIHEIQLISNEAFSRHIERIIVPKIYHPFITGPFNRLLEALNSETGAKVNVPPANVQRDEISITGERGAVLRAKERVLAVYEEKKRRCQTVSIEVKKAQHKYIVGPKGATLNEIFEMTGVSVEMPSTDSAAETIILRGEPDKLANALAVLYQKAHSETEEVIEVPGWIQRHLLGPKGVKFQELSALHFPKVNVSLEIEEGRIRMAGPIAEVAKASEVLRARAEEIAALLAIEEIKIADAKHIKFIVGKNGANLRQIREETNATINVIDEAGGGGGENRAYGKSGGGGNSSPGASSSSALGPQFIRIEGTRESVAKAKAELQALLKKLENEVSYELVMERRFYGQIIGAKGEKIRDIRNKFNQVQVVFPEQNETSQTVVIRGAKKDAEACFKHLSQMYKELLLNNHRLEVPIFKQLVGFLQGKDSIKSIREETGTRIDVDGDGDLLVITGKKEAVERARDRIQAVQATLADMSTVDIIIPAKIHHLMLGPNGRNIKPILAECGGVLVNFPPEGSGSDKVQIRGPKEGVAKAKAALVATSNDYQTNNYSEELKVRVEHHRYLIGRNGANINKLKEETGVRVYFSSDQHHGGHGHHHGHHHRRESKEGGTGGEEVVTITGKKEAVVKARALLEAKIKELDKTVEAEMRVDPKYHHLFVARRAAVCKQLYEEYGGVNVSFPPLGDKNGSGGGGSPTSDRIQLKGAPECVEAVKRRIAEIIADHEAQVTLEVEVEAVHRGGLLTGGPRNRISALQVEHDVRIKFPARPKTEKELQAQQQANGGGGDQAAAAAAPEETEEEKQARTERANIVLISGRAENCEAARRALLALIPVTATVAIPYEFHRYVIGQKGVGVRELMDRCNVNIRVPPPAEKSDLISVTGSAEAVERAREELGKRLAELEGEKADRQARSYQLSFPVNPQYHPKIIGKRGAVITKIRTKHNVQINVPESGRGGGGGGGEASDLITVIGYEADALAAKETILAIVKEQEELVTEELSIDNRIHSRLIGSRGMSIRKVMKEYNVDIRFPKTNAAGEADPDLVLITGQPEAVEEAKEHLLEVADSYLDDIEVQYQPPTDHQFHINFEELSATATVKDSKDHHQGGGGGAGGGKGGFQVRGGPWEKKGGKGGGGQNGMANNQQQHNNGPAPDTNNAQEFPAFGGGPGSADPSSPTADGGLGDDQLNTVGTAWARKNGFN